MKKQVGFTLIEIMIAIVIGLIVIAATINIYIATARSNSDTIRATRLNHDLEAVMALMINDIRRAGFWGGARMVIDSRNNPFTAANTNVQIHNGTCILYTYDGGNAVSGAVHDSNGAVETNEHFGFRLDGTTIRMRKSGNTTASAGCGTTDQEWEEFIDGNLLTITNLQFSISPITTVTPNLIGTSRCLNVSTGVSTDTSATACSGAASGNNLIEKRVVNIVLEGQLTSDPTVTKRLNGTVEIRNNRLRTVP